MSPLDRFVSMYCLALIGLAAAGCSDAPTKVPDQLEGGVLATFKVQSDTFRVWTDRPETIRRLEAFEAGESQANIPNGRLRAGPGRADHNAPWSWHLDPQALEMAELTTEVCDGRPSFVESNLEYWLQEVGRYCPWSAELVRLEDFR